MIKAWAWFNQRKAQWFPERHIYLRSADHSRVFVLSTRDQLIGVGFVAALLGWCLLATGSFMTMAIADAGREASQAKITAYYERLNADRQARLQTAVTALGRASGSIEGMARDIEKRHAALAMLLQDFHGAGAASAKPMDLASLTTRPASEQIAAVRDDQERLLAQAETLARSRAERLGVAIRMAGLDPSSYSGRVAGAQGVGGPLVSAQDPAALAVVLDVDPDFAARIQHAAADMSTYRALDTVARQLPLAKPVASPVGSSTYGVRLDPFTHETAFHPGQDFSGQYGSAIFATAPGVVSFTGQRTGYGNVVEVDHGRGFKTRYAHLASFSVRPGQSVGVGQRVGSMGSTGRSTGTHLHYEVWENGRVRDPTRFLKAGENVQ